MTAPAPLRHSRDRPPTLADAMARLVGDRQLGAAARKKYAAAIRTTCGVLGRAPEALPADFVQLTDMLKEVPAAVHGRSRKTIANVRSSLKSALLRSVDAPLLPPRGTPLSPAWAALRDRLGEDLRLKNGLSRLMRLASHLGLAPEAVGDASFERLVATVKAVNWGRDVLPFRRDVPRLWNEAVARVPGWPPTRLTEHAAAVRPAHLPLTAFPVSFQKSVEAHLAWAAGRDPFANDAPSKPLKPSTLRLRREQLRIAASTLARHLGDPTSVIDLTVLVQPANVKAILTPFHTGNSEAPFTAFARGLLLTLQSVAKNYAKAPPEQLAELKQLWRFLGHDPAGLTRKNRAMLRQFEDERVVVKLIALPDRLRKEALTRRMALARRLQRMRIALAIDILLVAPMRIGNLSTLRLDRQLQWPNGRSGDVFIVLEEGETKNEQALEYPLPTRVRDALHDYLDRYRLPGKVSDNPWLFVDAHGTAIAANTLRDGITKAVKRELGVTITPHQFRHLAAKIALDAQPGALGLVQNLLGHRNLKTTQRSYAGMRTREAGRFYDQLLTARRDPSPTAK